METRQSVFLEGKRPETLRAGAGKDKSWRLPPLEDGREAEVEQGAGGSLLPARSVLCEAWEPGGALAEGLLLARRVNLAPGSDWGSQERWEGLWNWGPELWLESSLCRERLTGIIIYSKFWSLSFFACKLVEELLPRVILSRNKKRYWDMHVSQWHCLVRSESWRECVEKWINLLPKSVTASCMQKAGLFSRTDQSFLSALDERCTTALSDAKVSVPGRKAGESWIVFPSPQCFLEGAAYSDLLIPAFQEAEAQKSRELTSFRSNWS